MKGALWSGWLYSAPIKVKRSDFFKNTKNLSCCQKQTEATALFLKCTSKAQLGAHQVRSSLSKSEKAIQCLITKRTISSCERGDTSCFPEPPIFEKKNPFSESAGLKLDYGRPSALQGWEGEKKGENQFKARQSPDSPHLQQLHVICMNAIQAERGHHAAAN